MPNRDRSRGALIGLAVGDALGTTLEFTDREAPPFPELAVGPHREMVGGGPFEVAPGQVTDDTQLACCLVDALHTCRRFDADETGRRYLEWRPHAFDIGNQTSAALAEIAHGTPALEAGRRVWGARTGNRPAGNGSLMRTAPIGVYLAERPDERLAASLGDSAITHYDPRCRIACAALNAAIATAVRRDEPCIGPELLAAGRAEVVRATEVLLAEPQPYRKQISAAKADLLDDLAAAGEDDPELYGPEVHLQRQEGFVRVAFRLAFWELMHAPSFEAALVDVVNRGGDADTNGAIAGALLGACRGEQAIPKRWRTAVLKALQDRRPSPLRDRYHPKRLMELVP